ncbi:MAG: LexA family transcriptional regulator [Bacteroidales bacterium]|nr:LexA family transcriptional regulator [Candidatus Scybalocola fimicaballi]
MTSGGKRAGAGRPKTDSKLYTFRAGGEIAKIIDSQPNKTDFILSSIKQSLQADISSLGEVIHASTVKETKLPFFDIKVVAGFPIPLDNDEISQDIELIKMLCPHPEASYLIRVKGDSMIDAGVMSGDIVIVDKSNRNPNEHEMAICELNGEYTLKQVMQKDGKISLVPANSEYPIIEVKPDDMFSVWGTVTYIIHKARL